MSDIVLHSDQMEDLIGIVDPEAEGEALLAEAWADQKLATEVYLGCVDATILARENEELARRVLARYSQALSDLLEDA